MPTYKCNGSRSSNAQVLCFTVTGFGTESDFLDNSLQTRERMRHRMKKVFFYYLSECYRC